MIIDLTNIGPETTRFDLDWSPEEFQNRNSGLDHPEPQDTAWRVNGPVTGWIELTPEGEIFRLKGQVQGELSASCHLCLKQTTLSKEVEFELRLVRSLGEDKSECELTSREMDQVLLEGDELDLAELVWEQLLLNSEMVIYCRPDCAGLCSKCGADLNDGPCGCDHDQVDPRLAALADWRPGRAEKEN